METREEHHIEIGKEKVKKIKRFVFDRFDWVVLQSAVTLYIYRVGKTYPAKNSIYRSKSIKNSNYSRILNQTGRAPTGSATAPDRSDRLMPILAVNICLPTFW